MPRLVSLTIPIAEARRAASGISNALLVDPRQVIKSALATAFGEDGVRPWRLAGDDGENYLVAGWLADRIEDARLAEVAGRIKAEVHLDSFRPTAGQSLRLDLHASPQRSLTRRDPKTGKRRNDSFDAARGQDSPKAAYVEWMHERLDAPRTGIKISGDIRIRSTNAAQGVYRSGDRFVGTRIPQVQATVEVEVVDPGLFEGWLREGFGPLKHVGYGCVIPGGIGDDA